MNPRLATPLLLVLSLCQYTIAQGQTTSQTVSDNIQKGVVFLYGADTQGKIAPSKPLGTGFLIQVPLLSKPDHAWVMLVTARHIVNPEWAHCPGPDPPRIFARFNKKNYDPKKDDAGTLDLLLSLEQDGKKLWTAHRDGEVDAAILPLFISLDSYDYEAVPVWLLPTPNEQELLTIGSPVVSAGLIPGVSGKKRNYPFFKFGHISSKPAEPVEANCIPGVSKTEKAWFIAANLVPGNSGSPIFFIPPTIPLGAGGSLFASPPVGRPLLIGVQSLSFLAYDVAGMTPSQFVYEMIEGMKLPDADLRRGLLPQPSQADPSKK